MTTEQRLATLMSYIDQYDPSKEEIVRALKRLQVKPEASTPQTPKPLPPNSACVLGKMLKRYYLSVGVDQVFEALKDLGYVDRGLRPDKPDVWVLTTAGEEYGYEYLGSIFWYVTKFRDLLKQLGIDLPDNPV